MKYSILLLYTTWIKWNLQTYIWNKTSVFLFFSRCFDDVFSKENTLFKVSVLICSDRVPPNKEAFWHVDSISIHSYEIIKTFQNFLIQYYTSCWIIQVLHWMWFLVFLNFVFVNFLYNSQPIQIFSWISPIVFIDDFEFLYCRIQISFFPGIFVFKSFFCDSRLSLVGLIEKFHFLRTQLLNFLT